MTLGKKMLVLVGVSAAAGLFLFLGASATTPSSSSGGGAPAARQETLDRAWASNWAKFTPLEHQQLCDAFQADGSEMYRDVFPNFNAPISVSEFNTYMYRSCP